MNNKLLYLLIAGCVYAPIKAHTIIEQPVNDKNAYMRYYLGKSIKFGLCATKEGITNNVYEVNGKGHVVGKDDDKDKAVYTETEHGSLVWKTAEGATIQLTTNDLDTVYPYRIIGIKVPRSTAWVTAGIAAFIIFDGFLRWKQSKPEQDQKKKHKPKVANAMADL
jgi:hypothetical protein